MRRHPAAAIARLLLATSAAVLVGLSCGTATAATPAFVSATSATTTAPSQTLSIATPTGVSAGHVLVATVAARIGSATAISAPTGWTAANRRACTGTGGLTQAIFVRAATAAEPGTHTFTATAATGVVGAIAAYTGVDLVQPVLAASSAFARSSLVLEAPSVTASIAKAMLLGVFAHSGLGAITPPAGMTVRADVPTGGTAPTARALMVEQSLAAAGPTGPRRAETQQGSACTVSQLVALRPGPDTPVNLAPPLVQGTAQEGRILTATTGTWTGSPTSYSYQWQRSATGQTWVGVGGATSASYTVRTVDVGMAIRVVVVAANASGSRSAASAPTPPVLPAPPVNLSPPQVSGGPMANETLAATPGSWSGAPTSYVYAWERCDLDGGNCVAIEGTAGVSYTLASADVGRRVRVVVTASNAGGSASAASQASAAVEAAAPPTSLTSPSIAGVAQANETLTADAGSWSGWPTLAYRWQQSGDGGQTFSDIPDAVGSTYTPGATEIGLHIRVRVIATNRAGEATAVSNVAGPVLPATPVELPVNLLHPTMAGVLQVAGRLTARPGTWSGSPAYAYQWQRATDGGSIWADLAGAIGQTYTLGPSDVGAAVRVMVTAVNSSGSATAASAGFEVYPAGNLVAFVNRPWGCNGAVDIDLVKVTIDDGSNTDAIRIDGCSGRIGRVEVDTNGADGIKVRNGSVVAQDLAVEGGYVRCTGHPDGAHQDGIQVMGGYRLTFRALVVWCGDPDGQIGDGVNSQVMIALGGAGTSTPTDVVFERSAMGPGSANGFFVQTSIRSGIRDSVGCPDLTPTGGSIFLGTGAVDGIDTGNEELPASDPRCTSFEAALAWAETPPAPARRARPPRMSSAG